MVVFLVDFALSDFVQEPVQRVQFQSWSSFLTPRKHHEPSRLRTEISTDYIPCRDVLRSITTPETASGRPYLGSLGSPDGS